MDDFFNIEEFGLHPIIEALIKRLSLYARCTNALDADGITGKYVLEQAGNASSVATPSGLGMSQNSLCPGPLVDARSRRHGTFEEVDAKLKDIMENIFRTVSDTAMEYGLGKNYMAGANIAGFIKVADSMIDQGIV